MTSPPTEPRRASCMKKSSQNDVPEKQQDRNMSFLSQWSKRFLNFYRGPVSNEALLKKNRKRVNKYLKRIGRQADLELSLDSCYIPFRKFLIFVEVPEDDPRFIFVYTKVFDLETTDESSKLQKRVAALQLTGLHLGKKGSTIHVDRDEVNLTYATAIEGLRYQDLFESLEDFMATALETNYNLRSTR